MPTRRNPHKKTEPRRKARTPVPAKKTSPKPKPIAVKKTAKPALKSKPAPKAVKPVGRKAPATVSLERNEEAKRISARGKKEKPAAPVKKQILKEAPVKPQPAPKPKAPAEPKTPAAKTTKTEQKKPASAATPAAPAFQVNEARPQPPAPAAQHIPEPPPRYGITRLVLMARDPDWAFSYWEITQETIQQVMQRIGAHNWNQARHILRVYDVTSVEFNGSNAHRSWDVEISPYASSWYLHMPESDRSYIADIGLITPYGEFVMLARSNPITMPRAGVSDVLDEEWATINYEELFRLSGGLQAGALGGGSAFMMEEISKRLRSELEMGSMAVSSFSGRPAGEKEKKFWLIVNTELIVYGATEPDAKVTVQDVPVRLNPDGTFSLRFALPDGQQVIPVKALSVDGTMEQKITPIVKRTTE